MCQAGEFSVVVNYPRFLKALLVAVDSVWRITPAYIADFGDSDAHMSHVKLPHSPPRAAHVCWLTVTNPRRSLLQKERGGSRGRGWVSLCSDSLRAPPRPFPVRKHNWDRTRDGC